MSPPDKLLEPDRYHWMAFPLDRTPVAVTGLLEPAVAGKEVLNAPPGTSKHVSPSPGPGREVGGPGEGRAVSPPVRERVFNPELKQATRQVLEHPAAPAQPAKSADSESMDLDDSVSREIEDMIHHDESRVPEVEDDLAGDDLANDDLANDDLASDDLASDDIIDDHITHDHPTAAENSTTEMVVDAPDPADLGWVREVPPPMPVAIVESLFHLFAREDVRNQDFHDIMEYIRSESKADALAGMLFDPIDFVYRLYLHDGIDPCTRKNIFFALNDNFLDSESAISVIKFADFKDDFFFSKRFSTDFFKSMQGAVLVNLNVYELPGFFMLFYKDLSSRDDNVLRRLGESIVRDLVPLVQRLRRVNGLVHYRTTLEDSRDNYTLRLYQLLKELSHSGKDPIRVIQVNFEADEEGGPVRPYLIQICEKLRTVLGPRERVAILPPGRLSVMLKSDEVDAVLEVVKSISADAALTPSWKVMRYPESGRNLLNYLR